MNIRIYRSLILLFLTILVLSACKKDLGNYDYKEINSLEEVSGLPPVVNVLFGDNIKIEPKLKFSLDETVDEADYTFEWSYIGSNGLGGSKLFSLAKTKNLDLKMTLPSGSYTAYYFVRDNASQVKFQQKFTLRVVNEFNEGWIMMTEANNKARVDMLYLDAEGDFDLVLDLLERTGSGLELEGKPVMTYTYSTGLLLGPDALSYGLYLGTDKRTTKVEPNNFKWTPTMDLTYEMFGQVPTGFYADVIQQRSGGSSYMIGQGDVFFYNRALNTYYSAPISYVSSEEKAFKAAPFVGGDPAIISNAHAIFYDVDNKRFVKHVGTNASCTVLPDPSADKMLFSFKTGKDLEFMRWVPFNGGEIFAILKDPTSLKPYLARFNSASSDQTYYSEITGTDIQEAELYAVSPEFGYLFYVVGSKVYEYDMVYKTSKLMLDLGSKRVSYLNFYQFKGKSKYKDDNKLMVGAYDPSRSDGTEGSLDIYTVPGINGDLVLDKSFSGFGRIKSLTYRER